MLAEASRDIDTKLGKSPSETHGVIGAWADGAENSLMMQMPGWSPGEARVALAMKAHIGDQKSALLFVPSHHGNGFLASFPAKGEIGAIHQQLLDGGLQFHTLEPISGGAVVHVYGDSQQTADAVGKAAESQNAQVSFTAGHGEFIGTKKEDGTDREQRDDALKQYASVISAAQTSPEFAGRDLGKTWDAIRDHWGGKLSQLEKKLDSPRVRWTAIKAASLALLRREFDESQHPRDEAGKFTDAGGGGGSDKESEAAALDPTVVQVGGDAWNRATAARLESEYQRARAEVEAIVKDAVGQSMERIEEEDEEDKPPFVPEEWDQLSGDAQSDAEQQWFSSHENEFYNSEVENWHEGGSSLDDAKQVLALNFGKNKDDDDWALAAIAKYRAANDDVRIPFTDEQLLAAVKIEFNSKYGDGQNDPDVTFDDDKLQEPIGYVPPDPAQMELPGIEPVEHKPEDMLTEEMRDGLTKAITKEFNKEAESKAYDMVPPDYLMDSAKEFAGQYWDQMSDGQKFEWTKDNTDLIDGETSGTPAAVTNEILRVDRLPKKFDPLNETAGEDYKATQALARYLSIERAREVIAARGIAKPSREVMQRVDSSLWSAWKGSSTSTDGKLLQLATADELGGRLRTAHTTIDRAELTDYADKKYAGIGGYAGVKAYVRAKWETTQYLLDKAGVKELKLYRGISFDPDTFQKMFGASATRHYEAHQTINGYEFMPTLPVERNGAASTTTDPKVANGWRTDANRVVVRADVPRTAAVSIPAYGINVQSEHEVVVAGTAFRGWDAWAKKAPTFDTVPLKIAA
jgi:hypothetical protein